MTIVHGALPPGALGPMASTNGTAAVTYGLRYDHLSYARSADTPQAAPIRKHVLQAPAPDERILGDRVGAILGEQSADGFLADGLKALLRKLLTVLLRGQRPDGSWGEWESFRVFRGLALHGMLDELPDAPPLPPDWTLRGSIALQEGARHLAVSDGLLWTCLEDPGQVLALDPDDGAIARRLDVPQGPVCGIACHDSKRWLTLSEPNRLLVMDAKTGEEVRYEALQGKEWIASPAIVGDELWIADDFMGRCRGSTLKSWWSLGGLGLPAPARLA